MYSIHFIAVMELQFVSWSYNLYHGAINDTIRLLVFAILHSFKNGIVDLCVPKRTSEIGRDG